MTIKELFGVIIAILSGFIAFILQKWLFSTGAGGLIQVVTLPRLEYANNYFVPGALIVLLVSSLCALSWYIISLKWSVHFAPIKEMRSARIIWAGFSLPPVLSVVGVTLWLSNVSPPALPWLLGFLILNTLLVYWLSSVLSTPIEMVPAVLGASWLRLR